MTRTNGKRRALVVDDHDGTRDVMRRLLELHGYEAHGAGTLAEAHAKLECCELVLLDLRLPDGSGIDLLRRIRASNSLAKVAVTTGMTEPHLLKELHAERPDAIFTKPLLFSDLLSWLDRN